MAKGQKIGSLFYDIDGDNKELMKKIEAAKKEAVSIEKVFSNIKLNFGGKSLTTDVQKAQLSVDKIAVSQNKVAKSAIEVVRAEELASKAIIDSNNAKKQGLILDEKRRKEEAQAALAAIRSGEVELNTLIKQEQAKRKALIDEERLTGLRKRNAQIGVQGQRDLAASYGLTNKTMFNQKNLLQQMSSAMGIYFSIYQAGAFVKELATISGEFEKQRVSLAAIIGDAGAANKIFNQIKDLAVISPFNFKELTDYAKQLSAFSIPTNEIFDTTKRLADLSAGLGVDMSRIILAYGQVRSAAVLRGQELRQFTEAGIPLVDELAKKFGELEGRVVSAGEVFDKISNREASFGMVKEIINDLTSEGGKFFEMQELQSATLAGKISNLRDNYDMMLDSLGKANQGLLHGTMDGLVELMDNWEKYWTVLKGIIATYGAYRAAIIMVRVSDMVAQYGGLIKMIRSADFAQKALNSTLMANPYVFAVTAIAALVSILVVANSEANKLNNELVKISGEQLSNIDKSIDKFDDLYNNLKNSTEGSKDFRDAISKLNNQYGEYLPNLLNENNALTELKANYDLVTQSIYNKAKAEAYDKGIAAINEQYSDDSQTAYNTLLRKLQDKGIAADAAKSLVDLYTIELKKQTGEYNPKDIFNDLYKSYFGVNDDLFGGISDALNTLKQSTPFIRNIHGENTTGWQTARDALWNYSIVFSKQRAAEDQYSKYIDTMFAKSGYKTQKEAEAIENINKKYKDAEVALSGQRLSTEEYNKTLKSLNTDKLEEILDFYEKSAEANKDNARLDIIQNLKDQLKQLKGESGTWRSELQDILGDAVTIKTDSNFNDVLDEMGKKYKEVKERMEQYKPILIKAGFDFDTQSFPSPMNISPILQQAGEVWKADKKDLDNLNAGAKEYNTTLENLFGKKSAGDKKDALTEKLKTQLDLVKSAKSEYEKLIKVMSGEEALKNIKSISAFDSVNNANLTDSGFLSFISSQIDQLKSKSKLTDQQKQYLISLFSLQNDTVARIAKENVDKIEKELSKYKDQYSLYETLLESTGDKALAIKVVFGNAAEDVQSYRDRLKAELDKTTDPELKKKLQEQLSAFDLDEKSTLVKSLNDTLKEYKSFKDKKAEIDRKYDSQLTLLESLEPSDEVQEKIDLLKQKWGEALSELEEGALNLNPLFMKLFGDIGNYGTYTLNSIISKTDEMIKSAKRNADGTYTMDVDGQSKTVSENFYLKLTKQTGKAKDELAKRNPFTLLVKSIQAYANAADKEAKSDALRGIITAISEVGKVASNTAGELSSMFDSLGNESMANAMANVETAFTSISNIGEGFAKGGVIGGIGAAVGEAAKMVGKLANAHDENLNSAIKISQEEVKKLQRAYKSLEYEIENVYGEERFRRSGELVSNLYTQQAHLYSQLQSESDKKKSDDSVIEDYKSQIDDVGRQIKDIFTNIRNEVMGTSESLASSLANSLVDAFLQGENAAVAWGKTVDDIVTNIVKNILISKYITPEVEKIVKQMMDDLTGASDTDRSEKEGEVKSLTSELSGWKEYQVAISKMKKNAQKASLELFEKSHGVSLETHIANLEKRIEQANTELGDMYVPNLNKDVLNEGLESLNQLGSDFEWMGEFLNQLNFSSESLGAKDTLSKGIQSVTEDTASLLASYLNAIRADVSAQNQLINNILILSQANSGTFANMYAELVRIQINTANTASNTARIADTTTATYDLLKSATIKNGVTGWNLL